MRNYSYENDFDLHENETGCRTHFHMKGLAFSLVLKQRHKITRKWPIFFIEVCPLEKSDSLGTKSRRKRLWDYLGTQVKTNKEEFTAECRGVDCSGDSKVLTELQIAIRLRLLF